MKVVPSQVAAVIFLTGLFALGAGCGPSASICTGQPCGSGKPVEVCEDTNGNVSYDFGGTSCSCNTHNPSSCDACASKVDAYCYPSTAP